MPSFLVHSACNLGNEVLPWAPGHVLAWARDALRWSPNDGHAWDLRGRALHRLGHPDPDIAQAIYWEAVRRLPENTVVCNQLARLLLPDQAQTPEAEALFLEAQARDPDDAVARNELARLLAHTGRESEAEELLCRTLTDLPDNPIIPYTLALLLIVWNRPEEAAEIAAHYARAFGEDKWSAILRRLLNAGAAGIAEAQRRLADQDPHLEPDGRSIDSDTETTPGIAAVRPDPTSRDLRRKPGITYPIASSTRIAAGVAEARPYPAYHDPHPKLDGHPIESAAETARREAALKRERRSLPALRGRSGRYPVPGPGYHGRRTHPRMSCSKDDLGNLYPQVVWALRTPARRAALSPRVTVRPSVPWPHTWRRRVQCRCRSPTGNVCTTSFRNAGA